MPEWNDDELMMLLELKNQGLPWSEVASAMAEEYEYREYTPNSCRKKYNKIDNDSVEDGSLEDLILEEETPSAPVEDDGGDSSFLSWTDEEMVVLNTLRKAGLSYKSIAELMSKSVQRRQYNENICKKKWNSTNWEMYFQNKRDLENRILREMDNQSEKQRIIEQTVQNHERLIKQEKTKTELIIDGLKSSVYRLPKPKQVETTYRPSGRKKYTEEHMGVILSDLHVGAKYTKKETGGLGEYNLDIFKKRIGILKTALLGIAERHRNMYDVPHLHVFCLGDIVAGMNDAGSWSSCYIDLDIYDQMIEGFSELRNAVSTWSQAFPKITVYGIYGNHGRVGPKGSNKSSANWDRIIYSLMKESLSDYPNIEWKIPEAWWMNINILNHWFYLAHGDGIKGSMGIPYYGVERNQSRIAALLPGAERPDYVLMGHFHSTAELSTNYGKVMMNGSFMGGDMYSLKDLARGERPEQKIFGIHHKKGVTWSYNIHLDEG